MSYLLRLRFLVAICICAVLQMSASAFARTPTHSHHRSSARVRHAGLQKPQAPDARSGAGALSSASAHPTTPPAGSTTSTSQPARTPAARLVWSDDFNGPAGSAPDPSKWQVVSGFWGAGNNELEDYTTRPSNVALDGAGHLAITAQSESYTGSDGVTRAYTSGRLQTKGLFQFQDGTVEASIKLPAGAGLWPAFWALGGDIDAVNWPACGEIDMMENIGSDPFTVFGSIHGPTSASASTPYGLTASDRSPTSLADGFHTYGATWTASAITFTLDGVPYVTRTRASLPAADQWAFNKPFFLLLNLAVGGNWPGSPTAATKFPATMLVDWVRVYQ